MVRAWLTTKRGKFIYVSTSDGRNAMLHRLAAPSDSCRMASSVDITGHRSGGRQADLASHSDRIRRRGSIDPSWQTTDMRGESGVCGSGWW